MNDQHTFVILLAGGGGTRLWPKSRNATPKQFLSLYTQQSLMQDTYRRARLIVDAAHILVVSNKDYVEDVKKQLPEIPPENIIGEPAKKETAPALLLGAMIAQHRDPEAVLINLASDHIAQNEQEFVHVLKTAAEVAADKSVLVAVGITATFPHSGLGYIKIGDKLKELNQLPIYKVDSFTEKPSVEKATEFIATGKYFWNACNYVWSAQALMDAFQRHNPTMLETMKPVLPVIDGPDFMSVASKVYEKVEKIAIDYAISEKADNLVLIPGDFGWNDIGDWKVVYDLNPKDSDGNVILGPGAKGESINLNSHNNIIQTSGRLVSLVGVEDMIVIDTPEILMIIPKSQSQEVKKIVEKLKEAKKDQYL